MTIPSKPSPLGQRTAASSRRSTTTSDPIISKFRQHQKAKTAKRYRSQPWLKELSMQTRQMDRVRRRFLKIQSGFYWAALRDGVMGEDNRATNKYFLEPMTAVAKNNSAYKKVVKKPMDFRKMERKWCRGVYHGDWEAIRRDFNLLVENTTAYFPRGHRVHAAAKKLRRMYEEECEGGKRSDWMNSAVAIAHEEGLEI